MRAKSVVRTLQKRALFSKISTNQWVSGGHSYPVSASKEAVILGIYWFFYASFFKILVKHFNFNCNVFKTALGKWAFLSFKFCIQVDIFILQILYSFGHFYPSNFAFKWTFLSFKFCIQLDIFILQILHSSGHFYPSTFVFAKQTPLWAPSLIRG